MTEDFNASDEFKAIIEEDRQTRTKRHWRGTMLEYLELVKQDPSLACLSQKRIYDMIM
ncbi:MAG: hypothetical protein GYA55_09905, partial [SAR324 cluster bacterium]|nr:hypothetical protein [SAR324 cluster bacterium]